MGLFGGGLGTVLGGTAGFLIGGPAGAAIGAGIGSGLDSSAAAQSAAATQADAANRAADLQYQMYGQTKQTLSPFVTAGANALGGYQPFVTGGGQAYQQMQGLLGLGGANAQQQAIDALQSSPTYQAQLAAGQNAMLQNAAATGGLRGGNTQNALMQYSPTLLSNTIQQQLTNLGGLASTGLNATQNLAGLGQSSAAGVGAAGQNAATNMGTLMGQSAAATAGGQIAQGQLGSNLLSSGLGMYGLSQGLGLTGGSNYGMNLGTALQYGTNPYSQQTSMLAAQNF